MNLTFLTFTLFIFTSFGDDSSTDPLCADGNPYCEDGFRMPCAVSSNLDTTAISMTVKVGAGILATMIGPVWGQTVFGSLISPAATATAEGVLGYTKAQSNCAQELMDWMAANYVSIDEFEEFKADVDAKFFFTTNVQDGFQDMDMAREDADFHAPQLTSDMENQEALATYVTRLLAVASEARYAIHQGMGAIDSESNASGVQASLVYFVEAGRVGFQSLAAAYSLVPYCWHYGIDCEPSTVFSAMEQFRDEITSAKEKFQSTIRTLLMAERESDENVAFIQYVPDSTFECQSCESNVVWCDTNGSNQPSACGIDEPGTGNNEWPADDRRNLITWYAGRAECTYTQTLRAGQCEFRDNAFTDGSWVTHTEVFETPAGLSTQTKSGTCGVTGIAEINRNPSCSDEKYVNAEDCDAPSHSASDVCTNAEKARVIERLRAAYGTQLDYLETQLFTVDGSFAFELRGQEGVESVTIYDGMSSETHVLTTEWQTFTASHASITIEFTNDAGSRNVFFQSGSETTIASSTRWDGWNCETDSENTRCELVREGRFYWNAKYEIEFHARSTTAEFLLTGKAGTERVTILSGDYSYEDAVCKEEGSLFRIAVPEYDGAFTLQFTHLDGSGDHFDEYEVYFSSQDDVEITLPEKWGSDEWDCDSSSNADANCDKVRAGDFLWSGDYLITMPSSAEYTELPMGDMVALLDTMMGQLTFDLGNLDDELLMKVSVTELLADVETWKQTTEGYYVTQDTLENNELQPLGFSAHQSSFEKTAGFCSDIGCNIISSVNQCNRAAASMLLGPVSNEITNNQKLPGCFYDSSTSTVEFNYSETDSADSDSTDSLCSCPIGQGTDLKFEENAHYYIDVDGWESISFELSGYDGQWVDIISGDYSLNKQLGNGATSFTIPVPRSGIFSITFSADAFQPVTLTSSSFNLDIYLAEFWGDWKCWGTKYSTYEDDECEFVRTGILNNPGEYTIVIERSASPVDRLARAHYVACGKIDLCTDGTQPKGKLESFNVRCVSDVEIDGWLLRDGIWSESNVWGECLTLSFDEATEFCVSVGGRLPTLAEVEANSVRGTGCNFDLTQIWTSTPADYATPTEPGFIGTCATIGCSNILTPETCVLAQNALFPDATRNNAWLKWQKYRPGCNVDWQGILFFNSYLFAQGSWVYSDASLCDCRSWNSEIPFSVHGYSQEHDYTDSTSTAKITGTNHMNQLFKFVAKQEFSTFSSFTIRKSFS